MLELVAHENPTEPHILVVGVGGGGNNAVERMIEANVKGVTFAAINTDIAVLNQNHAQERIQIGDKLLKGYGAGADPALGEAAAQENIEEIKALVEGYDMVIVTCGMGGGTGTGAAPIIAKCCKESGILTMGVVTTPFLFENQPRMTAAESGVAKMKENVDSILIIPNEKLLKNAERNLTLKNAFVMADSVLRYTIEGITNIVYNIGEVNIDFNDLKTTLVDSGVGHLGIGKAEGDNAIVEAVKQAVNSPLLDTHIEGAAQILFNTSGTVNVIALEEATTYLREIVGDKVNIIWGTVADETQKEDAVTVTLIATGMPEERRETTIPTYKPIEAQVVMPKIPPIKIDPLGKNGFKEIQKPQPKEEKQIEIPVFLKDYTAK